jgi:hypothetical protein
MHHSVKRSFAAFLGIWFLLVMIGPEAVHSCPVHSSVSGGHAGHSSKAPTEHHMGSAHSADDAPAPKTSSAACSCPGDCAVTSLAALKAPTTTVPAPPAVLRVRTFADDHSAVAPHPDLVLPFAIGPPANAVA